MDRKNLSAEALSKISPALTLSALAELAKVRPEHLSAMASGKRKIGQHMSKRLLLALGAAEEMARSGMLPERKRQGRPR